MITGVLLNMIFTVKKVKMNGQDKQHKWLINMVLDLEEMSKKIDEALAKMTQEEIDKYFPPDTRPKGWLSIEEYLPMMHAIDIMQGYTLFKVKDKEGNEFESAVSDHSLWYYRAKEAGITHWWNG